LVHTAANFIYLFFYVFFLEGRKYILLNRQVSTKGTDEKKHIQGIYDATLPKTEIKPTKNPTTKSKTNPD